MTTLLAGATGLVGREIARQWSSLADAALGTLHLLLRRPDATLAALGHGSTVAPDFTQLPTLPRCTAALCTLGTTLATAGSQAAFRAVDFDAVLAFAKAAKAAGARRFGVVSALGADAAVRHNFYNRTKGEAEEALSGLGFERLVIARPSLLRGDRDALAQRSRPAEALALALARPVERLIPLAWRPIEAGVLARALIRSLADAAPGVVVLESAALQRLGTSA
jgi:uncharacterized protein YbjT (DUF2867 family)